MTSYAGMIGSAFSSQLDRLSQIIGQAHEPSIGAYKESLLRGCLSRFLPQKYSVGTGFIIFSSAHPLAAQHPENYDLSQLKSHMASHQLDIVVYDEMNYAPVFKDGDFVVLRPESVKAVVEVKGYLSNSDAASCIGKYASLARLWKQYSTRYRDHAGPQEIEERKLHDLGLFLMGWNVRIDKDNRPSCTGKTLRKKIVASYKRELEEDELKDTELPKLGAAYVYDDCVVEAISYNVDGNPSDGYMTTRGRFVKYDEKGKPFLDRDRTLWDLLTKILEKLDSPFNADYMYLDQSWTLSVLPHEQSGTTDLFSGRDVCPD